MDINKIIKSLESSNKENNEKNNKDNKEDNKDDKEDNKDDKEDNKDNKEDNKLNFNKNINKNYNPIVFILNSTGFKIWWLLGIYDSFLTQNINIQDNIFLSYSSGAISTAIYLSGISGKKFIQICVKKFEEKFGLFKEQMLSLSSLSELIRPILEEILPEDCHLKCSNRLHIIYYNFPFGYEIVYSFTSKTDLIDHLCMCCYIPYITKNIDNNSTLSDTFIGISNETIYNFVQDNNLNIEKYRFYYSELHNYKNLLEKFNKFFYCDKNNIIKLYNQGVSDSNIYIYKYNLERFKKKLVYNYLSIEIYKTKKFKIKKKQKNFYIFKQLLRYLTIIIVFFIIIYNIIKIILFKN